MYRTLLVPVAYEPGHDPALELAVARHLAGADAEVTLLHVMDPVPPLALSYLPPGWRDELIAAIEADLGEKARTVPGGRVLLREGDAARVILDAAHELAIECIVLKTHRIDTSLFGSTAARVVRYAPCAVHLLR